MEGMSWPSTLGTPYVGAFAHPGPESKPWVPQEASTMTSTDWIQPNTFDLHGNKCTEFSLAMGMTREWHLTYNGEI